MKHKGVLFLLLSLIVILGLASHVSAFDTVISNSQDWKDVYSVMLYSSLIEKSPGLFLTSAKHGTVILYTVSKEINGTLIVSSRNRPHIVNYKAVMDSQGYRDVVETRSVNINLDLAERIVDEKNINKFIIVDDAYGYDALSVASYAAMDQYYVLFANERNIPQIDSFLGDVNPQKIILFGQVDEAVKTRLAKYNPETINLGDRFDNNIEMVKRYVKVRPTEQILMSNGEFIESSIMSGQEPVLFIGRNSVPPQVQEYVKSSNFKVAVLIGNELINSATAVRRQLGISVFVKFAQGARNPEGSIAAVEDLDKFPMPSFSLSLQIFSIMYNKATNQLWLTYKNNVGIGTYLQGTITLTQENGETITVGDADIEFIDKNQYKTLIYDVDLEGDNITAKIYTLFGEGRRSLENILQATAIVEGIEIMDGSLINITKIEYDKAKGEFLVTIKNIGDVDAYVSVELIDVYINGQLVTISSPETVLLRPGESKVLKIEAKLSENDLENNPVIKVKGYYGEKENSLVKRVYGEYALQFYQGDILIYVLIVLIIILLLLILFGRKKCPHCGTKNSRTRKLCRKCGERLYSRKIRRAGQ